MEFECPACCLEEVEVAFKVTQRMAMLYADVVDECVCSAFSRDDGGVLRWDGRTSLLHLKELPGRIRDLDARVAELESAIAFLRGELDNRCACLFKDGEPAGECWFHKTASCVPDEGGDPSDVTWRERAVELESLVKAQAERIASQSEALSRRAERGG